MPSSAPKKLTIKKFAHDYFMRVSFVDLHGRDIGYDYDFILAEIRRTFPGARTSRRWLQTMAYALNRDTRLPVRRRSRRALAEDYAMVMLMRRSGSNVYDHVTREVKKKFAEQHISADELRSLDARLKNQGRKLPPRPE